MLTDSWQEIVNDDEIQIVIEVMGGMEPARTYIMEAMQAGKQVVTANKDLIAADGKELMDQAKKSGCDLLFEAAVAGAIPIIRPLKQCLAGNHLSEIMGIVNGTTNFILTKMAQDGMEFEEALALATELGYAEADPTADIEGLDAGRKVAIMASIAFNSRVTFDDVYTEGITKITASDIRYAKETGSVIKLLGVARNTPEGIEVRVHPMLIPERHPLASVNDSFNAVLYMVMPWMMPCSTAAEPENFQRQVRWSEISLILPETSNMSAAAGSVAPATNSCRSKRWMTSVLNTSCVCW